MRATMVLIALVLGVLLVASRGPTPMVAAPRLIAIGGGLDDENEAIFAEVMGRNASGKIVVCPYASKDQAAAGESMIRRFRKHRADANVVVMPEAQDETSRAKAAQMIRGADLVYFTGGDQSRIVARLFTDGKPNAILETLRSEMLKTGTQVAGTSAGCAMMSDPMFLTGGSESALANLPARDGEDDHGPDAPRGVQIGQGLGLVRGVIMDSHFLERGRHGRMVAALDKSGLRLGVGVNEDRAVVIFGGRFRAVGNAAALVVDAGSMTRDGLSRRGVRVSLLSNGDVFAPDASPQIQNVETGSDTFAMKGDPVDRLPPGEATAPKRESPWRKRVLNEMLLALARDPATPQKATSERFEVTLSADARTKFYWSNADPATLAVREARLDIIERDPANPITKP